MYRPAPSALSVFCGAILCAAQPAVPIAGQWTLAAMRTADQIQLTIRYAGPESNLNSSTEVPLALLRGLTRAEFESSGATVAFELNRDAGTLHFQGFLQNRGGGGTFTFNANPAFAPEMRSLGLDNLEDEMVFAMAVHDVSPAYVRELRAAGVDSNSAGEWLAMRIHKVTADYDRELEALGLGNLSAGTLIAMRIHGVSGEYVRDLGAVGYRPTADQLIAFRIHGIDAGFIRRAQANGIRSASIEQLLSLKIHGVLQ